MIRSLTAALLTLPLLASLSFAAQAISFENALHNIRQSVLATRQKQIQAKDAAQASKIRSLANDLRRFRWDVQDAKRVVSDIRRRAQRAANDGGRDGDRSRQDPFLRNDINRALWNLRDLNRDLDRVRMTLGQLLREAKKSPESVSAAADLASSAGWMQSDAGWLQSEARWARSDLRRAGYTFEGWDIERECDDIDREARDLERDARTLQSKVQ